jgi:hypothetical protein
MPSFLLFISLALTRGFFIVFSANRPAAHEQSQLQFEGKHFAIKMNKRFFCAAHT